MVSVLCFHNLVPVLGWFGYSVTVGGCLLYGRCKTRARAMRQLMKSSMADLVRDSGDAGTPDFKSEEQPIGAAKSRRTFAGHFFGQRAFDDVSGAPAPSCSLNLKSLHGSRSPSSTSSKRIDTSPDMRVEMSDSRAAGAPQPIQHTMDAGAHSIEPFQQPVPTQ